jgi:DNA end-binding protein Ku
MRAIWTGTVGFGLVQIPVRLMTRERSDDLQFHQIDSRDGSPVGYERVNRKTGGRVEWKDVVKGYAVAKDRYVIVTDEDFEKANVQASQSIEIQDFVPAASIPPEFFARPYVLVPGRSGAKAYRVLRDALSNKKLVAVGLFVLRTRQHLCAVLPEGDLLSLEVLRFAHELKSPEELTGSRHAPAPPLAPKEVALAEELVARMKAPWDPDRYKDSYRDDLLAAIREKAEKGTIEPRHAPAEAPAGVIDLAGLLEKSLSAAKGARPPPRRKPRHEKRATRGGRSHASHAA